jgi:hypothetical protein
MNYTIDPDTFAIKVFDGINPEPFMYQPDYPNGDKFDSIEEATAWAEDAIKSQDPSYGFYPPVGKGLTGEPKPNLAAIQAAKQSAIAKLIALGLTADEVAALTA